MNELYSAFLVALLSISISYASTLDSVDVSIAAVSPSLVAAALSKTCGTDAPRNETSCGDIAWAITRPTTLTPTFSK